MNDAEPPASMPNQMHERPGAQVRPRVVLDTQVVLDWLLFADPSVDLLARTIQLGALDWVAEAGALSELLYVLNREQLARYRPNRSAIEASWAQHCRLLATPTGPIHGMVCRDPDDQRFIDLALSSGSTWLFSRDRAVLALARRARAWGLTIVRPDNWPGLT